MMLVPKEKKSKPNMDDTGVERCHILTLKS